MKCKPCVVSSHRTLHNVCLCVASAPLKVLTCSEGVPERVGTASLAGLEVLVRAFREFAQSVPEMRHPCSRHGTQRCNSYFSTRRSHVSIE